MPKSHGIQWRRRRNLIGLTSEQVGARIGITGGALRQIESGAKPASLELARRAAHLFDCEMDDLVESGVLTAAKAADALGFPVGPDGERRVQDLIRRGEIGAVRVDMHLFVPVAEVAQYLAGGDGTPTEPPQKEQEQETNTSPPPRKDKDKKGPKRTNGAAA